MSASDAIPTLRTERLLLRGFRETDLDAFAAIGADPEVMRYLGDGRTFGRDDAWRQMAMFLGHWALRGFGPWAVEERSTGAYVGRVGLYCPEGWPGPEVGWVLARAHWGKGFALEAARAALDHAFRVLGWSRAISVIQPDNARSIRVAERLGERLDGDMMVRGQRARIYAIDAETWRQLAPVSGRTL